MCFRALFCVLIAFIVFQWNLLMFCWSVLCFVCVCCVLYVCVVFCTYGPPYHLVSVFESSDCVRTSYLRAYLVIDVTSLHQLRVT